MSHNRAIEAATRSLPYVNMAPETSGSSTIERRSRCPFISLRHVLRHIQAPEALPSLYGIEEDGVGIGLRWYGARNYARNFLHPNSADVRVVHKVSYNFWFNNTEYDADRHSRTFNINGNDTPRFDRLLRSTVRLFEKFWINYNLVQYLNLIIIAAYVLLTAFNM